MTPEQKLEGFLKHKKWLESKIDHYDSRIKSLKEQLDYCGYMLEAHAKALNNIGECLEEK